MMLQASAPTASHTHTQNTNWLKAVSKAAIGPSLTSRRLNPTLANPVITIRPQYLSKESEWRRWWSGYRVVRGGSNWYCWMRLLWKYLRSDFSLFLSLLFLFLPSLAYLYLFLYYFSCVFSLCIVSLPFYVSFVSFFFLFFSLFLPFCCSPYLFFSILCFLFLLFSPLPHLCNFRLFLPSFTSSHRPFFFSCFILSHHLLVDYLSLSFCPSSHLCVFNDAQLQFLAKESGRDRWWVTQICNDLSGDEWGRCEDISSLLLRYLVRESERVGAWVSANARVAE